MTDAVDADSNMPHVLGAADDPRRSQIGAVTNPAVSQAHLSVVQAMSAYAAPRASLLPPPPAPAPVYGGAYDCLVCGVSVRRTPAPALRCARCPCRPFHRACAPPGSPGARACPQCAQASVVPFAGALTRPAAGPCACVSPSPA